MTNERKTTNAKMTAILVALIATTMTLAAHAGKDKGKKHRQNKDRVPMMEMLDLTAAQQTKVDAIKKKNRTTMDQLEKELKPLHAQLRTQWEAKTIDKKKIREIQKKMHHVKGKMLHAKTSFRFAMHDVLTPEQRTKAAEQRKRVHSKRPGERGDKDCRRGNNGRRRGPGLGHGPGDGRGPGHGPDDGRGLGHGPGGGRGPGHGPDAFDGDTE